MKTLYNVDRSPAIPDIPACRDAMLPSIFPFLLPIHRSSVIPNEFSSKHRHRPVFPFHSLFAAKRGHCHSLVNHMLHQVVVEYSSCGNAMHSSYSLLHVYSYTHFRIELTHGRDSPENAAS